MNEQQAPSFCTDKHLDYLDALRESGKTNMFGARPYLVRKFPSLSPSEAGEILSHWMKTFPRKEVTA